MVYNVYVSVRKLIKTDSISKKSTKYTFVIIQQKVMKEFKS